MKTDTSTSGSGKKRSFLRSPIPYILVAAAAGLVYFLTPEFSAESADEPLFTVQSGPLDITVTTPGTIQSRHSEIIKSKAQGRNTILWIIEEGTMVTNGQLLVDLDSSELEKQLTDQQITVGNTEASMAQSREKLAIAKIEQDSSVSAAELKLNLTRLEFEKYYEGEFPQQLQDAENKIVEAEAELERARETLSWTQKLAAEGFVTRRDLQADELSLHQKEISLQSARTSMNLLTNYTARQQQAKLKSDIEQAERDLDRAQRQAKANVSQAESDLKAREYENKRQVQKLETLSEQIKNCKITSTTNGIVIYASTIQASRRRWGSDPLQAGSTVYQQQELIHIPVTGGMIVEFSVPESDLRKLSKGLSASLKVDALPDSVFTGKLTKIGLLPDGSSAWLNPDLNLYNCEISIDPESGEELRAGMNCEVSMLIESYKDVISVPLQCVLRVNGVPSVFMLENGVPVPRQVKIGFDNGRLVHVTEGLKNGDQIMLAPPLAAAEAGQEEENDAEGPGEKGDFNPGR